MNFSHTAIFPITFLLRTLDWRYQGLKLGPSGCSVTELGMFLSVTSLKKSRRFAVGLLTFFPPFPHSYDSVSPSISSAEIMSITA